jgi:hypothetical protein
MGYPRTSNISETEVQIQAALLAYKNKQFSSIHAVACHFKVPYTTLHCCIAGGQSQAQTNETRQILSNAEEKILVRWVSRYTIARSPMTPSLLKELAEFLCCQRVRHALQSKAIAKTLTPIGHK